VSRTSEGASTAAVARVRAKVQEAGPGYTGFLLLQRLFPDSVRIHPLVLTGRRVTRDAPADLRGIRWGTRDDLARLPIPPGLRDPLAGRLAAGERFCVLEDGDRVLAFAWYRPGPYPHEEFGLRILLSPRQVWGSDAFVAREGRGRGLGSRLLSAAPSLMAEEDHDLVLAIIDRPNRNMARLQRATGAVHVADLLVLRIGPVILLRESRGGRARWHLGRGAIPLSVREAPRDE
jgi:GNAT superfamily N-acetyltransferase